MSCGIRYQVSNTPSSAPSSAPIPHIQTPTSTPPSSAPHHPTPLNRATEGSEATSRAAMTYAEGTQRRRQRRAPQAKSCAAKRERAPALHLRCSVLNLCSVLFFFYYMMYDIITSLLLL